MIKVLCNEQVRIVDRSTIERKNIRPLDLMEQAASACTTWLLNRIPEGSDFLVVAGQGNNGGDGMAIARMLWQRGKSVDVVVVDGTGTPSDGFRTNTERWNKLIGKDVRVVKSAKELPARTNETVIIDALFGSGLNRPASDTAADVIKALNEGEGRIISIDIPSGLFADRPTPEKSSVIRSTTTLCLQIPRMAFFLPEYQEFVGNWELIDIGLDTEAIAEAPAEAFILSHRDIAALQPPRPLHGHKGTFGHALLLAGSRGKAGAAVLTAGACLRSGAGLVTVRTPGSCVIPVQVNCPEAMCDPEPEDEFLDEVVKTEPYDAIGIGPGLGASRQTGNVVKRVIQDHPGPLVIDADALNILSDNPTWLAFLPAGTILTPHPGEFARLAGKISDSFDRIKAQQDLAKKHNVFILLKGRFSTIACPDGQLYINPTGNHGMAKGGSGDALTGLITGLLASGLSPMRAVLTGAYVHGLAGDLCAKENHPVGMTSGDLVSYIPSAFKAIEESL